MRVLGLATSMLLGALLLQGCGSTPEDDFAAKPAKTIEAAGIAALKAASSVHVVSGPPGPNPPRGTEVAFDQHGTCTGSEWVTSLGTLRFLVTGGRILLKGDRAYWNTMGAAATKRRIGDRWALVTPDSSVDLADDPGRLRLMASQAVEMCRPEAWVTSLTKELGYGSSTPGARKRVGGRDTVEVVVHVVDGDLREMRFWVAVTEPHYLVRICTTKPAGDCTSFDRFGEDLHVSAPSDQDVVELSAAP